MGFLCINVRMRYFYVRSALVLLIMSMHGNVMRGGGVQSTEE